MLISLTQNSNESSENDKLECCVTFQETARYSIHSKTRVTYALKLSLTHLLSDSWVRFLWHFHLFFFSDRRWSSGELIRSRLHSSGVVNSLALFSYFMMFCAFNLKLRLNGVFFYRKPFFL